MQDKPWEDYALAKEPFLVAETLMDEFAPDPMPLDDVTGCFVRLFRRPPRDDEMMDVRDHLRNADVLILGADERFGRFPL